MNQRVTFLTNLLGHGGAGTQIDRVSRGLAARGWDVAVLTLRPNERPVDNLQAAGVTVDCLYLDNHIRYLLGLFTGSSALRSRAPGALVAFLFQPDLLARVLGHGHGFEALISGLRNENIGGRWRERILKALDSRTNIVMSNARRVADAFERDDRISTRPISVVPNAVDLDRLHASRECTRQQMRTALGFSDKSFVWISVGQERPQKNYPGLIEAFARIHDIESHLVIVGSGHSATDLDPIIQGLGLGDRVHRLGPRTDVPDLLGAADGFALASDHEGSSNALIEAAALGLPCIATDVGGARDVVTEGRSGFLVAAGDVPGLADAMARLAALDLTERGRMGDAARADAVARFGMANVLDEWEDLLYRVLER